MGETTLSGARIDKTKEWAQRLRTIVTDLDKLILERGKTTTFQQQVGPPRSGHPDQSAK
jgi:hypothetical protein